MPGSSASLPQALRISFSRDRTREQPQRPQSSQRANPEIFFSFMTQAVATTREQRVNQRSAVLAGFLGWTFDAFDFFVLTLVIDDVAKSFGTTRPQIALALTA